MLYEFYQMKRTDAGWQAAQASIFDLKTNAAARRLDLDRRRGLPIFPAVVRYDELQARHGGARHAGHGGQDAAGLRRPGHAFRQPAEDPNLPRMGERIRLRGDFDVSGFSPTVQAILKGLKKYGMFVADNGLDWAISVAPDPRIPPLDEEFRRVKGSDFEVVTPP